MGAGDTARPDRREVQSTVLAEAVEGDSLWADAWRRLRRNRMAMVGLVISVVMSLTAIFAGSLSPFDPEVQQRWLLRAQPPMTTMLSLRNEMRLERGVRPGLLDVPQGVVDVLGDGREHRFVLEIQEQVVSPVRIVAAGASIERLELRAPGRGIERPDALVLAEGEFLRHQRGAPVDVTELLVGGPLPPDLVEGDGRYVIQLERVARAEGGRYAIESVIDGTGTVTAVRRDGTDVAETLLVKAGQVADATLDGRRLEHLHVLGTDLEGRDTLSRLLWGGRISLLVGLTATIVSLLIGVVYGAVSGYAGGRVDAFMMRAVDVLFGIPYLFLVILLLVAIGRDIMVLLIALGALQWLIMARVVRGQVLSLCEKEFVDAAITVGTRPWQILARHLIPNTLGVVVVYTTLTVPAVVLQESFLAFLGLTVEWAGKPLHSWGALVNYGREALGQNGEYWWLLVWPALAMSVTLFSLNFLGDGLRDALDPQQRGRT